MRQRNWKRESLSFFVFLFGLAVLVFSPAPGLSFSDPGTWLTTVDLDVKLTGKEKEALLDYAASMLSGKSAIDAVVEALPVGESRRILFLSVSDGKTPAIIGFGEGNGYKKALESAAATLPGKPKGPAWIKIDIVDGLKLRQNVLLTEPFALVKGLQGIAFPGCPSCVFLPETILAEKIIDEKGSLQVENLVKGGGPFAREFMKKVLNKEKTDRLLFETTSFFRQEAGYSDLYRGAPVFENPGAEDYMSAAEKAAGYLARIVDESGRFVYRYDPLEDRKLGGYNILRHAGTLYSMLEYYEAARDEEVLRSARRALEFLLDQVKIISMDGTYVACVVEDGEVKLGGNGLAVLAIAKYIEVTGDERHLEVLRNLCEWIVGVQDVSGRFTVHKQGFPDGPVSDFRSSYYPGEAIFGLMRAFEICGDMRWLEAADSGARYLITVRDRGLGDHRLQHDHWLLYGLNELYKIKKDELFAGHAFRIARAIMKAQNINSSFPDWDGGFGANPRSTPAATRMEGLGAAYRIAIRAGKEKEREDILSSLRLGNRFLLKMNIGPSWAMYMKNPARTIGGVRKSFTDFEIRIDYVQHSLSSFLSMATVLSE
jgi:hypothetical protein